MKFQCFFKTLVSEADDEYRPMNIIQPTRQSNMETVCDESLSMRQTDAKKHLQTGLNYCRTRSFQDTSSQMNINAISMSADR